MTIRTSALCETDAPPFVPDLDRDALIAIQREGAARCQSDPFFHDTLSDGSPGPALAVIPPGIFEMGSPRAEFGHCREESPQHYVVMRQAFAMGRVPVTADQFQRFQRATGWEPRPDLIWSRGDRPVVNLCVTDARNYLAWLGAETGQSYRLPTEAEWEYAARAGSSLPFHFGESADCQSMHYRPAHPDPANVGRWRIPCRLFNRGPESVGQRRANAWGLHDVHGNVWEMTASAWTDSHLGARRDGGASPASDASRIVTKGGSWFDPAVRARSAARMPRLVNEIDTNLGFRVLRELRHVAP